MSGFKRATVMISEEEYRRLHEADMERRFKKSKPRNEAKKQNKNQAFSQYMDRLEDRQENFEQLINQLGSQLSSVEVQTEQTLVKEKEQFYGDLAGKMEDIWENSARLEDILSSFQHQYQLDNQQREEHNRETNNRINMLARQQHKKNNIVMAWLQAAGNLAEFINNEYATERFAPGEMTKIYQELEMGQNNLAMGMPEAALSAVQQAYLQSSALRLELEQQTAEWQALFQVTWQAARDLYEIFQNNAAIPALDMEGNELPVSLKLNFWSNGKFNELADELKATINKLKEEITCISTGELSQILTVDLTEFRRKLEAIIYQVRFGAINSQLRINIADIALQALTEQGFVEQEFGYMAGDQRSPYYLRVKNIEGSEVTITVNPLNNQDNQNDLSVESHDSEIKTERELRQRSNEIINSLLEHGLQVGNLETQLHEAQRPYSIPAPSLLVNKHNLFKEMKDDRKDY